MSKFIVLSMEDSNSREIAKVISSETSQKILNTLADKRMSASELAKKLELAMSTTQYNLDLLKKVGMIKETAYRYSEKGRKVSYYEPAEKIIVIAPKEKKKSIFDYLQGGMILPVIVLIAVVGLLSYNISGGASFAAGTVMKSAPTSAAEMEFVDVAAAPTAQAIDTTLQICKVPLLDFVLVFIAGILTLLIILHVIKYIKERKN